jgi:hypothetical protein
VFSYYAGNAVAQSPVLTDPMKQAFVDGLKPAIFIGAVFVALGSAASFAIPKLRRMSDPELEPEAYPIGDSEPEKVLA